MCVNCEKKMLNIYRQGKTFTDQFYVDEVLSLLSATYKT